MFAHTSLQKSFLSSWLLIFFAFSLAIAAGISQLFQAPVNNDSTTSSYQSLFQPGQILGLKEMVLKNSLGEFHFERADNNTTTPWAMISPRRFPANSKLINSIVNDLDKIKIRNVHQFDAINVSNYSLDEPSLEVTLINNDKKKTILRFGLVNPIDNSTFVTLSNQKAIYHIDNIKHSLGNLDLTSFVNTKLLTLEPSSISFLSITRNLKDRIKTTLTIKQNKKGWEGRNSKPLEAQRVKLYFQTLGSLKSNVILDKVTDEQQKEISRYFEKPLYLVNIKKSNGKVEKYEISPLIRSLPGLKLEKWKNVLFRSTNSQFVYVLGKDMLKYFNRSERNMHTLPIKKLFY